VSRDVLLRKNENDEVSSLSFGRLEAVVNGIHVERVETVAISMYPIHPTEFVVLQMRDSSQIVHVSDKRVVIRIIAFGETQKIRDVQHKASEHLVRVAV